MSEGALAALGALLGYVGAEAATVAPFEHLFWPHRHLSNLSWSLVPTVALLMPMGGPLHKAALETFDTLNAHGLFNASMRGYMLGTAFFRDLGWTYTAHDPGPARQDKETRNCLWTTAVGLMRTPQPGGRGKKQSTLQRAEKGALSRPPTVRSRVSLSHLTFSRATAEDKNSNLLFVREGTKTPALRIFIAIIVAESTAVIIAVVLLAVWRTLWALLWLAPLLLRLLSCTFALHREPLSLPDPLAPDSEPRDFEIHCPQSNGDFMVFTGPPSVVLQFMRHYGHPVRSRFRETIQLIAAMVMGSIFPVGLISSALFMPLKVQYVWYGYQMYLVVVLHFARYSQYVRDVSTDAAIAEGFELSAKRTLGDSAILFGHKRHGPETIRVDIARTYHDRHLEGKLAVERLLKRGGKIGSYNDNES